VRCFFPLTIDAAAAAIGGAIGQGQDAKSEEKWEQGDEMQVEALSSSGGIRWRRGGRWGTEKVSKLILVASTSQASRERPNQLFSESHPNPPI
jgi:hypothetical protein